MTDNIDAKLAKLTARKKKKKPAEVKPLKPKEGSEQVEPAQGTRPNVHEEPTRLYPAKAAQQIQKRPASVTPLPVPKPREHKTQPSAKAAEPPKESKSPEKPKEKPKESKSPAKPAEAKTPSQAPPRKSVPPRPRTPEPKTGRAKEEPHNPALERTIKEAVRDVLGVKPGQNLFTVVQKEVATAISREVQKLKAAVETAQPKQDSSSDAVQALAKSVNSALDAFQERIDELAGALEEATGRDLEGASGLGEMRYRTHVHLAVSILHQNEDTAEEQEEKAENIQELQDKAGAHTTLLIMSELLEKFQNASEIEDMICKELHGYNYSDPDVQNNPRTEDARTDVKARAQRVATNAQNIKQALSEAYGFEFAVEDIDAIGAEEDEDGVEEKTAKAGELLQSLEDVGSILNRILTDSDAVKETLAQSSNKTSYDELSSERVDDEPSEKEEIDQRAEAVQTYVKELLEGAS